MSVDKVDFLRLEPGDTVSIRAPGGGGHGDPLDREPALVATDVRAGLVSPAAAGDRYGVVLQDGVVDDAATAARRARLRAERGQRDGIDYGPFRLALEERWPPDVSGECARLANTLPTAVRDYAKHRIFDAVQAIALVRRPQVADVREAWTALQMRLERALG